MSPTIKNGERVVMSRPVTAISRGDIVGFRYPADESKNLIQRIVGMPGDRIESVQGRIFIDDTVFEEPYVIDANRLADSWGPVTIPADQYFVMGDNRRNSSDSRSWGLVERRLIWAKVAAPIEAPQEGFVMSCDRFPGTLTEDDLRVRYGASNVSTASVPDYWGAEGETTDGVALFAATPDQRLEFGWFVNQGRRQSWMARTSASASRWRTPAGVAVGMDLPALEALNGRPFLVTGFEGDELSTVQSWSGGRLASQDVDGCRVVVYLQPSAQGDNDRRLHQLLSRQLKGERLFSSNDAAVRAIDPRVIRLMIRR